MALDSAGLQERLHRLLWPQVSWIIPLAGAVYGRLIMHIAKDVSKRCWQCCRSRKALASNTWRNRYFQFGVKYWVAYTLSMALIIPLQYVSKGFVEWNPYYVMITVVVVLCEKVETTLLKGVVRVITTVIGCVIGYLFMLKSDLATNPYGLMALLCVVTFLAGYLSLGPLKYGVFLLLITSNALVLCQYEPVKGNKGTALKFYARIVDIAVGVFYCLIIDLIWPWYTSTAALEGMGSAYKKCAVVIGTFMTRFHEELQVAEVPQNERRGGKGISDTGPVSLQSGIYGPLGGVQLLMKMHSVLWKTALLGTPPIVHRTFSMMRVLADRLTAAEVMLQQKPIITGRFTSAPYDRFVLPMKNELDAIGQTVMVMGDAVVAVLGEQGSAREMAALQQAINAVQDARMCFRRKYLQVAQDLALAVVTKKRLATEPTGDPSSHGQAVQSSSSSAAQAAGASTDQEEHETRRMVAAFTTPDDAVRFLSFIYAMSKAVDKATLLARMIVTDDWMLCSRLDRNIQQRLLWVGIRPKQLEKQQAHEKPT